MEESIYNLIPNEHEKPTKNKKYQSKFRESVKHEYFDKTGGHKTMGESKCVIRDKANFLKKHEKEPVLPARDNYKRPNVKDKIASVPCAKDAPVMGSKTTKNFITQNAVQNIGSVPRKPAHLSVDTKGGDKQDIERAGLHPKFIHKKNYGSTPEYITKRRNEVKRAQHEYDEYVAENFRKGAMKKLTLTDREEILDGLKTNWEHIHHEYQGLSVVTDTVMKKYRKERMENEMKSLERDIEAIEKHDVIYIAN